MEIDITDYIRSTEHGDISASQAELGADAGRITWSNAMREAKRKPMLQTEEEIDALRGWARESGGWTRKEISAWGDTECNSLFCQIVSGDWRQLEDLCADDDGEIDWGYAQGLSEQGTIGGNLYRCDIPDHAEFGRLFYYLGT